MPIQACKFKSCPGHQHREWADDNQKHPTIRFREIGILPARVAELVDAHVSGACSERSAGSSPVPGTIASLMTCFFYALHSPLFWAVASRWSATAQVPFALLRSQAFGSLIKLTRYMFFLFIGSRRRCHGRRCHGTLERSCKQLKMNGNAKFFFFLSFFSYLCIFKKES